LGRERRKYNKTITSQDIDLTYKVVGDLYTIGLEISADCGEFVCSEV
jgi:hypothetical protein